MPEPSLRARALNYLARRDYTRSELQRKLAPYAEDQSELESLLEDLEKSGSLSEQRFVEQMVHARQGKYGSLRIAQELRAKGIADELIRSTVTQIKGGELASARTVWTKKFGSLPTDAKQRAKQMRFLQSRGFSMDVIRQVLQGLDDEN